MLQGDPYTLVIALDTVGAASGELYLDDGRSYAHERGVFAHRVFTFRENTLTNAPLGGTGRKEYKAENDIERIIVLGLHGKKGSWQVSLAGSGSILDAAAGPLSLQPGLPDSALVIRKPGLSIAEDWSVSFSLSSGIF